MTHNNVTTNASIEDILHGQMKNVWCSSPTKFENCTSSRPVAIDVLGMILQPGTELDRELSEPFSVLGALTPNSTMITLYVGPVRKRNGVYVLYIPEKPYPIETSAVNKEDLITNNTFDS